MLAMVCAAFYLQPSRANASDPVCTPDPGAGVTRCAIGVPYSYFDQTVATQQADSEWCWAASLSMVLGYQGFPITQTDVVMHRWKALGNMSSGPLNDLQSSIAQDWLEPDHAPFTGHLIAFSPSDVIHIANSLKLNVPLLFSTSHHMMVVTGIGYTIDSGNNFAIDTSTGAPAITVWDPWPANYEGHPGGRRVLTASDWADAQVLMAVVPSAVAP